MKLLTVLWLIAAVSVLAGPVAAHHGTGISYDLTAPLVTVKGTVTEFAWRNPHVSVFVVVADDQGTIVKFSVSRRVSRRALKNGTGGSTPIPSSFG